MALAAGLIGEREAARKRWLIPDLLTLTRTFRRALYRISSLPRLTFPIPLDAVTGFLRVAMRSFLLMRRVRMILGLEVLGLVWGTFAIPGHEFLQIRKPSLEL